MCQICTEWSEKLFQQTVLVCIGCPNITHIPKQLMRLTHIRCHLCPQLTEIPREFTQLKMIFTRSCQNLQRIPIHLPQMRGGSIDWVDCPRLWLHNNVKNKSKKLHSGSYNSYTIAFQL